MEFTVKERLILLGLLPQEASYVTLKIITELKRELSFSEQEIKDYKIVEKDNTAFWDNTLEKPKNIEIGDKVKDIIVKALKELDKLEKINDNNKSLYERFVLTI